MASDLFNSTVLIRALDEWRALSEAESAALAAEDWPALAQAQAGKARLQTEIEAVRKGMEAPSGSPRAWPACLPPSFHPQIAQLIEMERRNLEGLAAKMESQRHIRAQLETTTRNLHNLRGSYGRRVEGFWESYS